jgi:hypothetical protein
MKRKLRRQSGFITVGSGDWNSRFSSSTNIRATYSHPRAPGSAFGLLPQRNAGLAEDEDLQWSTDTSELMSTMMMNLCVHREEPHRWKDPVCDWTVAVDGRYEEEAARVCALGHKLAREEREPSELAE